MARFVVLFACLSIIPSMTPFSAAQVPDDFRPSVAILHADDSDEAPFRDLVRLTLWYTAQEMHTVVNDLPHITVVHAPRAVSEQIGISAGQNGALLVIGDPRTRTCLFEMWIVGEDAQYALATGFVQLLTIQQGLVPQQEESMARRVSHRVSSAQFPLRAALKRVH